MQHAFLRTLALLLILLVGLSTPARAQTERVELESVPGVVRVAMMAGEYETALREIDRLAAEKPGAEDFWAYLRGTALQHAGRFEEAARVLAGIETQHPQSRWLAKARFRRAEVLRKLGRFEQAEEIYEAGARELRAEGRQRELAQIYLGFADELSTRPETPGPRDELDFARAFALYEKLLELDAPRDLVDRAMFRRAYCQDELGAAAVAAGLYRAYLTEFDPSREDSIAAREGAGTRVLEARLALGRALLAAGNPAAARREFEDVGATLQLIRGQGGGWGNAVASWKPEDHAHAEQLRGDAAFAVASTWNANDAGEALLRIAALRRFLSVHRGHEQATRAAYEIAATYRGIGRYDDALIAYDEFLGRPRSQGDEQQAAEAARLAQKALFQKATIFAAQKRFGEAIEAYRTYTKTHANGPDWAAAQQGIVETEYARCQALRADKKWNEARSALASFLQDHPLDARARQIYFDIGQVFYDEGVDVEARQNGRVKKTTGRFEDAVAHWRTVVQKYPGSDEASAALYHIGKTQADKLGDLAAAIESFRGCNFGAWSGTARSELVTMTEPTLGVRTERTWRGDEAAAVLAFVRNVEKLEVEIYALDLEAYFRKHLSHRSIEDLDLDLIAPDKHFEVEIEGYERFRGLEQRIELPVEGPGVWAVAISSEERRATTLVIRSDIDMIVKSSQREVFVYAQDMRAGEPAAGVSVLMALPHVGDGGTPVFHEAKTGADGVARLRLPELARESEVRLLALRDGHFASSGLELSGLGLQAELQPRGFVYTDRTAYRPGQEVRWRAILRSVEQGRFSFQAGERYLYDVVDARGRVIDGGSVQLSEFGTVHGELRLDALSPLGRYAVRLHGRDGEQYRGAFQVEKFRLQRIELALEFDAEVYYRGETVEITARAAYYYGEPVADSALRLSMPDGRSEVARTNDKGEAHFRFETRDMPSERLLSFSASLTEENVHVSERVWLALNGYSVTLRTTRELYLAGDRFHVDVQASAPDGEGLARDLKLSVLYREQAADGGSSEVLQAQHEFRTDEEGTASLPLQLDRGGWYTLRVEGLDRFGNPVVNSRAVFISGDEDDTRLRVLIAAPSAKVGEQVTLDIHNRAGAGLALLTLESEEVLEYRVLQVHEGHNPVEIQTTLKHFPNVSVSASLMLANHFYHADTELLLERELVVEILPSQESYAPGEQAVVELRATDALGRPVSAELSLAVVDEALFELFPDELPDAADFLQPERRQWAAMRTRSSCEFAYQGVMREVSQAVLDEQRDRARSEHEVARRAQTLGQLAELDKGPWSPGPAAPSARAALVYRGPSKDQLDFNDVIGMGGGAGGKFGGRFGGKRNLRAAGGMAASQRPSLDADGAFWAPAIVTDKDGRATVRFRIPERSTRWRLTCIGADRSTQVGEAQASLLSKAEFFLELLTPPVLVEGDTLRVAVRVHGAEALDLQLEVSGAGNEGSQSYRRSAGETALHVFEAIGPLTAGSLELGVRARSSDGKQALARQTLEVRPWGLERFASRSGRLDGEVVVPLRLPEAGDYTSGMLRVQLDRDVNRTLSRVALERPVYGACLGRPLLSSTASELAGVVAVIEMFERNGRASDPQAGLLRARARDLLARLLASQSAAGGWSLSGENDASKGNSAKEHTETSCTALVALVRARSLGLRVPSLALDGARSFLGERFRQASHEDDELKAMIVHALACAGQDDFAAANRLHRMRQSLSPAGLAYTARALVEMERGSMAAEVAAVLAERVTRREAGGCQWKTRSNRNWDRSSDGMTALALCALIEATPNSEWIAPAAETLESHAPWSTGRTRGLALEALAKVGGEWSAEGEATRVRVLVDGELMETVDFSEHPGGRLLELPVADGAARERTVRLVLEGSGRPHFSATLSGFSRRVEPERDAEFAISSSKYLAAAPLYRGQSIRTGFSVLTRIDGEKAWRNEVSSVAPGELFQALVSFSYVYPGHDSDAPGDYFTLEVPLPAGARLLAGSVQGGFDSFEERAGKLVFHFPQTSYGTQVTFTLIGSESGEFRALPPVLRHSFDPSRVAIGTTMSLEVLARGEESRDEYKPTPDELFHLGKAMYAHQQYDGARERLTALYDGFLEDLRPEILSEAAEMLLFLGIRAGDHAAIVRYFEVLKEKNPELYVPFEDVLAVGRAYRALGEFERALLIFKATLDETFGKDLKVAGTLDEQGEFAGAVDTLERFWLEYPDSPAVVQTYLALADKLLSKVPTADRDKSLRAAGRDRYDLSRQGILALQRFLAFYPESPLAPDAGLNLVRAYLALESYEDVSRLGGEMAEIYSEPRYSDAFAYSRAVAEWHLGHDAAAQGLLKTIAESSYTDDGGVLRHSLNRELAYYILAQIFHARREFSAASEYYERVKDEFSDASEVLETFREKRISLPEVTTTRVGQSTELELTHKNLASAELLVYSVDLMTLYLRERNLSKITQVNLAGISPTLRREVTLVRGGELETSETSVSLELPEPGAYLVICRGDELHTSGLVLVSDIELDVREEAASGRMRVTALDSEQHDFLRGVDVRVVGSASSGFQRGKTDPRGLFVADGVAGVATVIAQSGPQYAFYRGSTTLGVAQEAQSGEPLRSKQQIDAQSYFKNVIDLNRSNVQQRDAKLKDEIQRKRKGVQVQQVK